MGDDVNGGYVRLLGQHSTDLGHAILVRIQDDHFGIWTDTVQQGLIIGHTGIDKNNFLGSVRNGGKWSRWCRPRCQSVQRGIGQSCRLS